MRAPTIKHLVAGMATALTIAVTATVVPASAATLPAIPASSVSVTRVAENIKTVDPALRESVSTIVGHITSVQRDLRRSGAIQVISKAPDGKMTPAISHWGNTWYFSRYDVAWMAALSTAAFVAVLVYTCGIGLTAAWGMAGVVILIFWNAFLGDRCAYLTPHPFHAGSYTC
jgi:hypothetical protein